ncbi:MAG: hypothetical protein AB1664_19915 [Thermodesulfobacteriota bacterium]
MGRDESKETSPQIAQMAADSRDRQAHSIIGAATEIHRQLGSDRQAFSDFSSAYICAICGLDN